MEGQSEVSKTQPVLHVAEAGDLGADVGVNLVVGAADDEVRLQAHGAQLAARSAGWAWSSPRGRRRCRAPGVTWMRQHVGLPFSLRNWRMASTKAWPSMSPMVPPSSVMTTSAPVCSSMRKKRSLMASVTCGTTWTVPPRKSPWRSRAMRRLVDGAGGEVGVAREVLVNEALVVAQVQVGLLAVLGDEDLAVLERAHGARVHVEVGVRLLHHDLVAPSLQQTAEGGRRDALAKGRDDAAGHENVLCHVGTFP